MNKVVILVVRIVLRPDPLLLQQLFLKLEARARDLHIDKYGVADSTLEEVKSYLLQILFVFVFNDCICDCIYRTSQHESSDLSNFKYILKLINGLLSVTLSNLIFFPD